jgi:hypothetical protein
MPKLQATVPKGAPPNALLRVRLPDGTEVNVRIPEGLSEGQEFIFEVDTMGGVTASAAQTQTKSSAKKDSSLGSKSNKHAKKKNKKSNNSTPTPNNRIEEAPSFVTVFFDCYNLVSEMVLNTLEGGGPPVSFFRMFLRAWELCLATHKVQHRSSNNSTNNTPNEYVGLLDREIDTGVEFCVALCVGIFIGMSIVLGFIGGVLWVTPIGLE